MNRQDCCEFRLSESSIRIGNNQNPRLNSICKANIDRDGVYICDSLLTGTYSGITRDSSEADAYNLAEFRAYPWIPFDENNSIITSDVMPNASLANSVHFASDVNTGLDFNSYFSTGPATNCFWKMQLSSSMHVKVVVIMGDWLTKTNTQDWELRVGDSPDPLLNPIILSSSLWATEIKVDAWGQYVSIIRTTNTDPLKLGYVAVFATPFNCSLTNTVTVASLTDSIPVGSSHTYLLTNSQNADCIDQVSVVLQGTTGLPAFMSFDAATNVLTVTPGQTDFGTFILDFSVKTVYDGMAPSQNLKVTKVLTIYSFQIGQGTILDQTYEMGAPLILPIPTFVMNPAGVSTTITWAASPMPVWLSLSNTSITINSSDTSLINSSTQITIIATDSISGLIVSNSFDVFFKCTTSVNCSASFQSNLNYFITENTTITIPACIVTPSFCPNTTSASLTYIGTSIPSASFATMTRNADGTLSIALFSSNLTIIGVTYQFQMTFADSSVAIVTQPMAPSFTVLVKCTTSVNCSASSQSDTTYFITDATLLTIPACVVYPSFCANTSIGTLTSQGAPVPAAGFALLTKNVANTFTIALFSSDQLITDFSYQFLVTFSDPSVASVTQPIPQTFNVFVKCTKSVDCSRSQQNDFIYFISDSTPLTIPSCTMNPSICANTSIGSITSTGATVPVTEFATLTENADGTFTISLSSNDPRIEGKSYQFQLVFSDSSTTFVIQPATPSFNVLIKCTRSVNCSASSQSDLTYFLTDAKIITIPACIITPSFCLNLTKSTLTPKNSLTPANLATISNNLDGTFSLQVYSSDSGIINAKFDYRLDFTYPEMAVQAPFFPSFVISTKCVVSLAYQTNIQKPSFQYKIGQSAVKLKFEPFQQYPICGFNWSYILTILEIQALEDQVSFDPKVEGQMPEGLGTILKEAVYIKTGNFALKDRFFVAYVSGTLETDQLYQPEMKQFFELVKFKIIAPDFRIANSPPVISNFVDQITVFANESNQVFVADVSDAENNDTMSPKITATCSENPSDWIKLSDASTQKITLVLKPPQDLKDDTCKVDLKVSDNDKTAPMSIQKTIKITVKAQKFGGFQVKKDQDIKTIKQPVVVNTKVNASGKFSIFFDQDLKTPDQLYELNSQNNGLSYFNCSLQIDEANLAMNGFNTKEQPETKDLYSFSWQVVKTDTFQEIGFTFNFKNPWAISKYAKDKMVITFLKPEEFQALRDNKAHIKADSQAFELLPLQMREEDVKSTSSLINAVEQSMKVLFSASSVGSLFMSVLFTYLLGMINGMQIQALTCLFRIRLPSNAMAVMNMILKLASFDLFKTDIIYQKIFTFTKTESFTTTFDQAGFQGSNFIIGTGPLFGLLILYLLFLGIRKVVISCLKGKPFFDKKIVPWFQSHNIEITCLNFILEGNIDISFWSFICILHVKKNGIGRPHFSDVFSNLFAFFIIVPLAYAPFHLLIRTYQYLKQIKKQKELLEAVKKEKERKDRIQDDQVEQKVEAEQMDHAEQVEIVDIEAQEQVKAEEAKTKEKAVEEEKKQFKTEQMIFDKFKSNLFSLVFYFLFIMRRQIMVIVLLFMPTLGLFQLMTHILISFCMLLYSIQVGPYLNKNLNFQEICNEVFVIFSAYHLLLFTNFVPDNSSTFSGLNFKFQVGWSMIACIVTNLAINISIIAREFILKAIAFCRNRLIKTLRLKLEKLRQEQKEVEEKIQQSNAALEAEANLIRNQENLRVERQRAREKRVQLRKQQISKLPLLPIQEEEEEEKKQSVDYRSVISYSSQSLDDVQDLQNVSEIQDNEPEENGHFQLVQVKYRQSKLTNQEKQNQLEKKHSIQNGQARLGQNEPDQLNPSRLPDLPNKLYLFQGNQLLMNNHPRTGIQERQHQIQQHRGRFRQPENHWQEQTRFESSLIINQPVQTLPQNYALLTRQDQQRPDIENQNFQRNQQKTNEDKQYWERINQLADRLQEMSEENTEHRKRFLQEEEEQKTIPIVIRGNNPLLRQVMSRNSKILTLTEQRMVYRKD